MTLIRVYEHDSLKVNNTTFTSDHLQLLSKFLGDKDGDDFPYYSLINNGVKFKHYVGVISVGNLQIEILPKADRAIAEDEETWENNLLEMLKVVYKLKVTLPSKANLLQRRSHVLDVFLNHFLDEVENIMHIGLVKAYRRIEGNNPSLKGRLVMSKHIVKNLIHKERFYVDYTTYDRNHIFNRLLYKALRVIPDISVSNYTIHRAKTLIFEFPELDDLVVTETLFNRLSFDRKTEDYRDAMDIAKLILLNYMPSMTYNRSNNVMALMFDMNKLWEEYVYITLKRQLRSIDSKYTVVAQRRKEFWTSAKVGGKIVKPDIVVKYEDNCIAVLDTKWKCPKDGKPSDADLKQMFVYQDYWDTDKTALIYPGNEENVAGDFMKDGSEVAECDMYYLPIYVNPAERKTTLLDLSNLINFLSPR